MVTIFEGDDNANIIRSISSIKKSYQPNNIYEIDGISKNPSTLLDILSSNSLFGSDQLIIIRIHPNENITIDLSSYIKDPQTHVVLYGSLNARYANIKELKKSAKLIKLEKKESSDNFALCDAIFFKRDKKESINLINKVVSWDENFYSLIPLMQTYVRNLISKDSKNEYWLNLNPYFKSKFVKSAAKYSVDELEKLYLNLLDLEVKSKSGAGKSYRALLTDFVIYSI